MRHWNFFPAFALFSDRIKHAVNWIDTFILTLFFHSDNFAQLNMTHS